MKAPEKASKRALGLDFFHQDTVSKVKKELFWTQMPADFETLNWVIFQINSADYFFVLITLWLYVGEIEGVC